MKVNFIRSSYMRFYNKHRKEIDIAIFDRFQKGSLIMEQEVKNFEANFARFCKKKYCVSVRSGTSALILAKAVKKPTLMQKYRYRLPFSAREIGMKDGAIDLDDLKKVVKKGDCLLVTYMNSIQPDLKELKRIKKKYNLFIIEDACQAAGKPLIGDISCFSLYPAKMIGGIGKGGAIVSDNKKIIDEIRKVRDDKWNNLWLDEIKAAFLNVKLKYLPTLIKRRQWVANQYNEKLSKKVTVLSKQCLQNYIIIEKNHQQFIEYLKENGIEAFSDDNDFYEGNIKQGVRIPCYAEMTNEEVKYIIKTVNKFYEKNI